MKSAEQNKNSTERGSLDATTFAGIVPVYRQEGLVTPALRPDEERVAEYWNKTFATFERMWGRSVSQTAASLITLVNKERNGFGERIVIADLGCGYGRDAVALAKADFDVVAVDIARHGLFLARQDYGKLHTSLPGRIRFLHGTIATLSATVLGKLDGVSCHRVLHLMTKDEVLNFARCAAQLLRPGGFISIGARSPRDFDPKTMNWVKGQEGHAARYKDRDGHVINFLDEQLLRLAFEADFSVHFSEGIELERNGHTTATELIYMTGRKSEG